MPKKPQMRLLFGINATNERITALEKKLGQPTKHVDDRGLAEMRHQVALLKATLQPNGATNPSASPHPDGAANYEFNRLSPGLILFDPPETMTVGIPEKVTVRIAKSFTDEMLSGLSRRPTFDSLEQIGTSMKVQLKSDPGDFDIVAINSEEQAITDRGFTEWNWGVSPNTSGEHRLYIVAVIVAGDKVKDHQPYEKVINVKVNPVYSTKKFARNNWAYILTTILGGTSIIGGAVGLWRRYGPKKEKAAPNWERPE